MTVVYFIVVLGVLVFFHELGHFLMAKKAGIRVEKFSLGFGPKLFSFTKGETIYLVSLLPLGGYVKLTGQDEDEENMKDDPRAYISKTIGQRLQVVFAGPIMNIILALFLMPLVFMIGRSIPAYLVEPPVVIGVQADSAASHEDFRKGDRILSIGKKTMETWEEVIDFILLHPGSEEVFKIDRAQKILEKRVTLGVGDENKAGFLGVEPQLFVGNEAVIDILKPGGPAEEAGFRAGDKVIKIGDEDIETWSEMSQRVSQSEGKTLVFVVLRQEVKRKIQVTPQYDKDLKKWLIGIQKDSEKMGGEKVLRKYGFFQALQKGWQELYRLTKLTFSVLGRLVTLQLSYKTLGGPIRIAQASASAAQSGFSHLLFFMAFLSLQLGVLNLLPIPVLDGGHVIFLFWEKVMKKPLHKTVKNVMDHTGLALLLFLMLLVTLNDIDSVWGFRDLLDKVKSIF